MGDTPEWRQSRRKRAEVAAIAGLGYPVLRMLESTWRWQVSGAEHVEAIAAAGRQPILALWHGRILTSVVFFKNRGIVPMASENFDGEWITRLLYKFGYGVARGSTSRRGSAALRQLVRDAKAKGIAITLDGPRGPAEVAQPGAVWLAKTTGNPLLPIHSEAVSSWTLNSWDRTLIPRPFATVVMVMGQPIYIPRDADDGAMESWRLRLEDALTACKARCAEMLSP